MTNEVRLRRDVERNHAAILTAAIAVLADTPRATMSDIAHASGTGRSTLYRHFPDRETLIAAIFTRVLGEAGAIVDEWLPGTDGDDPIETIIGLCDALAALGERYRFLGLFQTGPSPKNPEKTRRIQEIFVPYLTTHQERGQIRSDLPGDWLMGMLGAVIRGASRRTSASERLDLVRTTVRSLLAPATPPA